jgi:hypothetical protein
MSRSQLRVAIQLSIEEAQSSQETNENPDSNITKSKTSKTPKTSKQKATKTPGRGRGKRKTGGGQELSAEPQAEPPADSEQETANDTIANNTEATDGIAPNQASIQADHSHKTSRKRGRKDEAQTPTEVKLQHTKRKRSKEKKEKKVKLEPGLSPEEGMEDAVNDKKEKKNKIKRKDKKRKSSSEKEHKKKRQPEISPDELEKLYIEARSKELGGNHKGGINEYSASSQEQIKQRTHGSGQKSSSLKKQVYVHECSKGGGSSSAHSTQALRPRSDSYSRRSEFSSAGAGAGSAQQAANKTWSAEAETARHVSQSNKKTTYRQGSNGHGNHSQGSGSKFAGASRYGYNAQHGDPTSQRRMDFEEQDEPPKLRYCNVV